MTIHKEGDTFWQEIERLCERIDRLENIVLDANSRGDIANNKYLQELHSQRNRAQKNHDHRRRAQ
jgi:hypothetical protein